MSQGQDFTLQNDLRHIKKFAKGTTGNATGQIEYMGYARPGTAEDEARWFIKKLTYDGDGFITDELFAGGSMDFNKSWTLRATYVYK